MKKFSRYILKYWYVYLFALTCMILQVGLDMMTPQITKRIVDDVIGNKNVKILSTLLILILIIGVGRCIFGYFKDYTFDWASSKISSELRKDLFRHIQKLSVNYFDKTNTGELMSRVKDDVDKIWNATGFVSMLIIEVVIHTGMILFFMIRLSPTLTILPLIAMPLCAFVAIVMEKKLDKIYEEISEENATLNTVAQENLAGVRTVKAFAREKHEITKFLSHNNRYYELNMKQSRAFIKYYPFFQFVSKLLPIIAVIIGGTMVIKDKITLGTLAAFAEYCTSIVWPMEMLGWLSNEFASAIASGKKIKNIAKEVPMIEEPETPTVLESVSGHLAFNHVDFSIDGKEILKNISFNLPAGKTIGIMGETGSGKTSIINLIQRFYDVTEGSITLDGIDIRELSLGQLRQNVAVVMQDVFLFSDSISTNVKLGKKNLIGPKEITEALEASQAKEFIDKLAEGCETVIGERGVGLSGGQKQRISIARALAKKTPILVLDDATSALDMETEHLIQNTLDNLEQTTKIIIAHRISAVRNADEIIYLENNRIVERGTHSELLFKKGRYYNTYIAQYGDFFEKSFIAANTSRMNTLKRA